MSLLLPSDSDRPLATSGTAVTPPVPVLVVWPAPTRWNQASRVNCDAPRAACPKVTYAADPGNRKALLTPAGGPTVTVMLSLPASAPSDAANMSTYVPGCENVA